jgi:hypothetical protein
MIEGLLAALGSAVSGGLLGGLVGLAGNWLKASEERKLIAVKQAHELAMREATRAEMELEATLALRRTEAEYAGLQSIAQTEAEAAREVSANSLVSASYRHDRASYGGGWVDTARGIMRPFITLFLLLVMTTIAWHLYRMEAIAAIAPADAWHLFAVVVQDATFLAVTATTWWFGSRPTNHRGA